MRDGLIARLCQWSGMARELRRLFVFAVLRFGARKVLLNLTPAFISADPEFFRTFIYHGANSVGDLPRKVFSFGRGHDPMIE